MNIKIKFSNNASARLEVPVDNKSTTITIPQNKMGLFPAITSGEYFMLTLIDGNGNYEIVKCTYKSPTAFTVVRAQEGTTAKNFPVNSLVEHRLTAGSIAQLFTQVVASTTEFGLVRIATDAEISNGVTAGNPPAVITPEGVAKAISERVPKATTTVLGISRQATDAEMIAGVTYGNGPAFCTPEGMKKAISTYVSGALAGVTNKVDKIEHDIADIKGDITKIESEINNIKGDIINLGGSLGSTPIGTILPYMGQISGNYPIIGGKIDTSWHVCNGKNGTPDLRSRYLVGSHMGLGGGWNPGSFVGTDTYRGTTGDHTLTINEIPSHTHNIKANGTADGGPPFTCLDGGVNATAQSVQTMAVGGNQAHSHTMQVYLTPRSYALYFIKKIK